MWFVHTGNLHLHFNCPLYMYETNINSTTTVNRFVFILQITFIIKVFYLVCEEKEAKRECVCVLQLLHIGIGIYEIFR